MVRYVLFESAVGYGLFEVQGVDQVEINSPKFQQSITKFEKFSTVCRLKAFYNFPTPEIALENQNDIAEGMLKILFLSFLMLSGILNHHLQEFLEQNLKSSDSVAVADTALYNSMEKAVNFKVQKDNFFQEISRAIRNHFPKFIKAYLHDSIADVDENYVFKSQRGLAHSYSRAKVKFNVNKSDNMIIQSISTLDHLDKDINTFAMRVRYDFLFFLWDASFSLIVNGTRGISQN